MPQHLKHRLLHASLADVGEEEVVRDDGQVANAALRTVAAKEDKKVKKKSLNVAIIGKENIFFFYLVCLFSPPGKLSFISFESFTSCLKAIR